MTKNNIYFIGAGGIGMAALERYFLSKGCNVAGYDRTPSDLTHALQQEGVEIVFDENPDLIPESFRNPETTLVVYTPAVPADHEGLVWFRKNGFEVVKRAAVLGLVTKSSKGICFAGTHGKTTTSSMCAHLLNNAPCGCNAFLGGVLRNYNTNFLLNAESPFSVIEADEFDRSFHHLHPYIAVVTSTDPDHLDIYGTEEAYLESFAHFTSLVQEGGTLILHTGLKLKPRPGKDVKVYTYSAGEGDFHARDIERRNGTITFTFVTPDGEIPGIELGVPVEINIENAMAAMAAAWVAGQRNPQLLQSTMKSFMGPKRRFEFHLNTPQTVMIDDYAHHPDELRQSILSVKALFPDRKLTVAFQPHLYTRTRDFAPEFAEALSLADNVILIHIYPARELPIEGVTSEIIYNNLTNSGFKTLISKEDLPATVAELKPELLLTAGAGDISELLNQTSKALLDSFND